jgi:hypothetical protein
MLRAIGQSPGTFANAGRVYHMRISKGNRKRRGLQPQRLAVHLAITGFFSIGKRQWLGEVLHELTTLQE